MRTTLLAALTLSLGTTVVAAPAQAAPGLFDSGCGFVMTEDYSPEAPAGTASIMIFGGPIAQNGTLTCTIKAGVATHNGSAVYSYSQSATGRSGMTRLGPSFVSAIMSFDSDWPVYLCDQFHDGATTWYWDGDWNVWTTNPAASCELSIRTGTGDPILDPVWDLVESLDPITCAVLATVRGVPGVVEITPQGDVYVLGQRVYDCPPYDDGKELDDYPIWFWVPGIA